MRWSTKRGAFAAYGEMARESRCSACIILLTYEVRGVVCGLNIQQVRQALNPGRLTSVVEFPVAHCSCERRRIDPTTHDSPRSCRPVKRSPHVRRYQPTYAIATASLRPS